MSEFLLEVIPIIRIALYGILLMSLIYLIMFGITFLTTMTNIFKRVNRRK